MMIIQNSDDNKENQPSIAGMVYKHVMWISYSYSLGAKK